jgi:hypothetical protein
VTIAARSARPAGSSLMSKKILLDRL